MPSGETGPSFHTHAAAVILFTDYYNTILPLPAQHGVHTEMTECPIPVHRQYIIYGQADDYKTQHNTEDKSL